jgi:serine protease inhibitor
MLHRGAEGSTKSQFEKLFGDNENDVKSLLDQTMSFVEKVVKSSDLDMKSVGALWVDHTFQLKPVEIFLTNL